MILLCDEVFIRLHWHKAKFSIKGMQPKPILIQFHLCASLSCCLIAVFLFKLDIPPFQHGFQISFPAVVYKNKEFLQ